MLMSKNEQLSETGVVINNKSQGSVATHLRCGGIFNDHYTTNLLLSPSVKELWKSVKIWRELLQWVWCLPFVERSVVGILEASVFRQSVVSCKPDSQYWPDAQA